MEGPISSLPTDNIYTEMLGELNKKYVCHATTTMKLAHRGHHDTGAQESRRGENEKEMEEGPNKSKSHAVVKVIEPPLPLGGTKGRKVAKVHLLPRVLVNSFIHFK